MLNFCLPKGATFLSDADLGVAQVMGGGVKNSSGGQCRQVGGKVGGEDTPGCVACHTSAARIFNFNDNSLATSCLTMNDEVEDDFAKVNGQENLAGRKDEL